MIYFLNFHYTFFKSSKCLMAMENYLFFRFHTVSSFQVFFVRNINLTPSFLRKFAPIVARPFLYYHAVPADAFSARKDLDDEDMLAVLDRCYNVLHGRRNSNVSTSSASTTVSIAGSTSILAKHIKRNVFEIVKHRLTKLDHNLYDVIWPSVKKLPADLSFRIALEQDFPLGIVAPDFYVYKVFKEFLEPIIKDYNAIDLHHKLPVHPESKFLENISEDNHAIDVEMDLDPHMKWIITGIWVEVVL